MRKSSMIISTLICLSLISAPLLASTALADSKQKIQNSEAAVQFFDDELNFTTTPLGAKMVVDGKVKNITIIDARSEKDFAEGHIPGAVNIPFDKYSGFEGSDTSFSGLRKNGYNYVYCYQLLCNLGVKTAKKFAQLGYPVKEIKGGFKSWQEAGYPIEK